MRLKDKVCVITGSGFGIGRAGALLFAKEGARVIVADINAQNGQKTVSMVKQAGGEATFVKVDVTKAAEVENMIKTAVSQYGRLDVLYNNAGILASAGTDHIIEDLNQEVWDNLFAVNLKGTFLCCKYGIPELIKSGGGSIINTSSYVGLVSYEVPAYCASKGGVAAFSKAVGRQYGGQNIRCNAICPGAVGGTYQTMQSMEAMKLKIEWSFPRSSNMIDRRAEPTEIAYMALYLASDESAYVTGAIFSIDGGVTAM